MNTDEISELIDVCAAGLRQTADPRDAMIWTATLGDLDFGLARQAVVEWLRTSPYWPRPADLRERARMIDAQQQRERAKRHQLAGRVQAVEDVIAARSAGANLVRHVLGRLKDAGQDIANGKKLGVERATEVADEAMREWQDRTGVGTAPPRRGVNGHHRDCPFVTLNPATCTVCAGIRKGDAS
jgi:hypothetical protein